MAPKSVTASGGMEVSGSDVIDMTSHFLAQLEDFSMKASARCVTPQVMAPDLRHCGAAPTLRSLTEPSEYYIVVTMVGQAVSACGMLT